MVHRLCTTCARIRRLSLFVVVVFLCTFLACFAACFDKGILLALQFVSLHKRFAVSLSFMSSSEAKLALLAALRLRGGDNGRQITTGGGDVVDLITAYTSDNIYAGDLFQSTNARCAVCQDSEDLTSAFDNLSRASHLVWEQNGATDAFAVPCSTADQNEIVIVHNMPKERTIKAVRITHKVEEEEGGGPPPSSSSSSSMNLDALAKQRGNAYPCIVKLNNDLVIFGSGALFRTPSEGFPHDEAWTRCDDDYGTVGAVDSLHPTLVSDVDGTLYLFVTERLTDENGRHRLAHYSRDAAEDGCAVLRLFVRGAASADERATWSEHVASPVARGARRGVCAGSFFSRGNALYRMAMITTPYYGVGAKAVRVTKLTPTEYEEEEEGDDDDDDASNSLCSIFASGIEGAWGALARPVTSFSRVGLFACVVGYACT